VGRKRLTRLLLLLPLDIQPLHDVGRRSIMTQLFGHQLHGGIDVIEEPAITGTQIIQPGLAVGCVDETVFRTFAVADEADFAIETIAGKRRLFVGGEFYLCRRVGQFDDGQFVDVA